MTRPTDSTEIDPAAVRVMALQLAWNAFETAAKRVLEMENMKRIKIDYSLINGEVVGTNELLAEPKRLR